jgi:hypothetical protein
MNRTSVDEISPSYSISEDEIRGIIRISVAGFFDRNTLKMLFLDTEMIVNKWKILGRPILTLIDSVNLKPHSPENQLYVEREFIRTHRPSDRVATLVASTLVKIQQRRAVPPGASINFFISESAAITWLTSNSVGSARNTELPPCKEATE